MWLADDGDDYDDNDDDGNGDYGNFFFLNYYFIASKNTKKGKKITRNKLKEEKNR